MALKHVITRRKPYRSTQSLRNAEKDTQSKQNSWGLTGLALAQLDQGGPRGPPYLHSVYSIELVRFIARYINPWRTVSTKIGSSAVYRPNKVSRGNGSKDIWAILRSISRPRLPSRWAHNQSWFKHFPCGTFTTKSACFTQIENQRRAWPGGEGRSSSKAERAYWLGE